MKSKFKIYLLFLLFNFGGLAIGAYLQGDIPNNEWYTGLNKAPWTPPGWVFGAAWTSIMLLYSAYMMQLIFHVNARAISILYTLSWVLNVAWSPVFFNYHWVGFGLFILLALFLNIVLFFLLFWKQLRGKSFLLIPYIIWLIIATSLNGYVFLNN